MSRTLTDRVALVVRVRGLCVATVHLDHGQAANRCQLRHLMGTCPGIDGIAGDFNALGSTHLPFFADIGLRATTHWAKGVIPLRLDRGLARDLVASRVGALPNGRSDHRPILVDLEPVKPRGIHWSVRPKAYGVTARDRRFFGARGASGEVAGFQLTIMRTQERA